MWGRFTLGSLILYMVMDIADEAQGVLADYRRVIVSLEEIDKAISFFD